MKIEPTQHSQPNFFNNNKRIIIKKINNKNVDDSFADCLKVAMDKPLDLTPQEKLAADGILLNNEEIILLKSILEQPLL